MTCIVGLVDKERIWMAADSLATGELDRHIRKDRKIFKKNGFLIGCAGSPRLGQVVRYGCTLEQPKEGCDLFEFMAIPFVNGMRQLFREAGCIEIQNECEALASVLLVGIQGRLFAIYGDLQVEEVEQPFLTIGSGAAEANASMWTSQKAKIQDPKKRITWAVEAAAQYNNSVSAPVRILSIGR